jgi:isopentenyldiphosphate isomerase
VATPQAGSMLAFIRLAIPALHPAAGRASGLPVAGRTATSKAGRRSAPGWSCMAGSATGAAEEHFDVLNPDGTPAHLSRPRSRVHAEGLWHRSTHVWVLSRARRAVLLQRRAAGKDTYPSCWDVSAAGHIAAGEESAPTALRELEEELGLCDGHVDFLFTARTEATGETERHGPFCDREFQDVYLYVPDGYEDVQIEDVQLQQDEVECVRWWDIEQYMRALAQPDQGFVPRSPDYVTKLFPFLRSFIAEQRR